MKVMGRRKDGVLLVDIGTKTAYAIDLTSQRYAFMGDVDSKLVARTVLDPIDRAEASALRPAVQRVLDRGKKTDLAFLPFQKKDEAEKRTCDKDTVLEDDEECVDGYIEKKAEKEKEDGGNPFA